MAKITMQDIARESGFSPTTVSMVLNGRAEKYHISTEAEEKIRAVAKKMGYYRNAIARAMITGKSKVIAFITPEVSNEYTAKILEGCVQESHKADYFTKIFLFDGSDPDGFSEALTSSLEYRCAGIFLHGINDQMLEILARAVKKNPIPVVNLDSSARFMDWSITISSDDEQGCALAVSHLREFGHERIGYLSFAGDNPYLVRRLAGYKSAMSEAKLPVCANYIQLGEIVADGTVPDYTRVLSTFFEGKAPAPTAIACSSDALAILAMRSLKAIGKRVPEDISVVGFSDMLIASYSTPSLTTIAQDFKEIGRTAFRCLDETISEGTKYTPGKLLKLPVRLVARESTAQASAK